MAVSKVRSNRFSSVRACAAMMKEFHRAPWSIKDRARLKDGFSMKRSTAVGFARERWAGRI